jgi:CheY-like chemotaxis protein
VLRALLGEDHPLTLDLAERLTPVEADGHQLFQVVLNLAANARDANAGGSRIVIRTRNATLTSGEPGVLPSPRGGEYAVLVVEDSGHGMDAATRQRVFEPFFTKKAGGTGLGLATVYGIVVQSGGHVRLQSEPGEGTTFEVFLPSAGTVATPDLPPSTGGEVSAGTAPEPSVVLLVEDQEAVRDVARDLLESWGFAVVDAASGASALAAWEERGGRIDALLSDVVMPGMRGPELARHLREARADLPVVFMSGYADVGDEIVQLPGPRAGFVAKPFAGDQLRRAIEEAPGEVRASRPRGTPA